MAMLKPLFIPLPALVPSGVDPQIFNQLNDLYLAFNTLVQQINSPVEEEGIILRSPNKHYWKVTIDDTGTLTTTDLGLVRPF